MALSSLSVQNFRTHELKTIDLDPKTTLILGPNGSGKTSLLEAAYLLHSGTSFKGRDQATIQTDQRQAEIKLSFDDLPIRRVRLTLDSLGKLSKAFQIGDKKSARLTKTTRLPVVLFEPDELRLLSSSPQRRRDFIDGIIARLSPTYQAVLTRHARTLLQRNELLKQYDTMHDDVWQSHLFAWDVKLAELSASIIKARRNFIIHSNQHLSRLYSQLASGEHSVIATYSSGMHVPDDGLEQAIMNRLEATRQADALSGYTSTGPHRDDMTLQLNDRAASETASRGEMRSIMLAFKLLEVELQAHHSGQKPLILLDDVFSELDIKREKQLLAALENYQTIITATDLRDELKKPNKTIVL